MNGRLKTEKVNLVTNQWLDVRGFQKLGLVKE